LREAAARGEHSLVVDVCESLHWFSDVWMHWAQWHELFALAAASAQATGDEAMESTHLGYLAWSEITERVDYEAALASAARALSIAERLDDDLRRGWALFYIGWAAYKLDDIATSTSAASESIQAFRRAGDADAEAGSVLLLAAVGNSQGNHSESIRVVRDYLDLVGLDPVAANRLQGKINRFTAYQTITDSYLALSQATMAIESATAALRIAEGLDDKTRIGAILAKRVQAYILAGQLQAADSDITTAFDLVVQGEDPYSIFQRRRLEALRAQLPS
jgi:tetratricopeptide (TPR) repeat protein